MASRGKLSKFARGRGFSPLPAEKCMTHPAEPVTMYCGNHQLMCCGSCVTLNHRVCDDVNNLPHAAKGTEQGKNIKTMKEDPKNVQQELVKIKNKRLEDLSILGKEKLKHLTDIDKFRDCIVEHLDDMVNAAKDEISEKSTELENKIANDIKKLNEMIASEESRVKNVAAFKGQLLHEKQGQDRNSDEEELFNYMETAVGKETVDYQLDSDITDYFMKLTSIGHLLGTDNRPFKSAKLHGQYKIKSTDDKKDWAIRGACVLDNGSVLISESENKKLKMLDSSYKITDELTMTEDSPWGVCQTSSNEAAIAMHSAQKIQFVSTAGKMALTKSFKVNKNCLDVTFNNGELFTTCQGDTEDSSAAVLVYNLSGNHLRTIADHIFKLPHQIAVSCDGARVYVADGENGVITLDRQGKKRSVFSDSHLEHPWGVCVAENDNVIVSGADSRNIFLLDGHGKKICILLKEEDGIIDPKMICYDSHNSRIIVTMWSNDISVYDLIRE